MDMVEILLPERPRKNANIGGMEEEIKGLQQHWFDHCSIPSANPNIWPKRYSNIHKGEGVQGGGKKEGINPSLGIF